MADTKLFRLSADDISEISSTPFPVERSLQKLFEKHLDALLGIRFVASEYSTGSTHAGRIDTLGLDEDYCPVIIEYKNAVNENVISQGLFYLDWLMDHKKEFEWLILDKFGREIAGRVDWSAARLICIAGDFKRYDVHAVKQISRYIELLRYKKYGDDLLMIELVHTSSGVRPRLSRSVPKPPLREEKSGFSEDPSQSMILSDRAAERLVNAPEDLQNLYYAVTDYIMALGDDVQRKDLKSYTAFKRLKNFVCLEVYTRAKTITLYLRLDPSTVELEPGLTRDMRGISHFGTGDVEVSLKTMEEFERIQLLLKAAYDNA